MLSGAAIATRRAEPSNMEAHDATARHKLRRGGCVVSLSALGAEALKIEAWRYSFLFQPLRDGAGPGFALSCSSACTGARNNLSSCGWSILRVGSHHGDNSLHTPRLE
jgi:hypothetical protein